MDREPVKTGVHTMQAECLGGRGAVTSARTQLERGMRSAPRRGVHQGDLPLRLTIDETGRRGFGYLIVRNDGTVALASSRLFATEAAARVAGLPVLSTGVPNFRSFL